MNNNELIERIFSNLLTAENDKGVGGDDYLLSLYDETPLGQRALFWEILGKGVGSVWGKVGVSKRGGIMVENAAAFVAGLSPTDQMHPAAQKSFAFLMEGNSPLVNEQNPIADKNYYMEGLRIAGRLKLGDSGFWEKQYRYWDFKLGKEEIGVSESSCFNVSARRKVELMGVTEQELDGFLKKCLSSPEGKMPAIELFTLLSHYTKAACPEYTLQNQKNCGEAVLGYVREIFNRSSENVQSTEKNYQDVCAVLDSWEHEVRLG